MALQSGQVLQHRYRVKDLLEEGGMGAVYRAWDARLEVPVALKEMRPQPGLEEHTLEELRLQFRREAIVLARLNHPHLVRVTDSFEEGGNAYLVMDLVEGESLAERIAREGPLPEAEVLVWAGQLLDALAYCHRAGVVHRDVKPQNVILQRDGRAVLVDFGLVKLWDPRDPYTGTVMRGMGTPEYAPPEQYDLGVGHTDPRSDLYSLGATLYHALTGQAPPTATQRMADPKSFVPPRAVIPGIGRRTEAAVLKALALPMSERFDSAEAMAQALGVAGGTAIGAAGLRPRSRPLAPDGPLGRPIASWPAFLSVPAWAWAVGGLIVLALVVVGILVGKGRAGTSPTSPSSVATASPEVPAGAGSSPTVEVIRVTMTRRAATPTPTTTQPTATRRPTSTPASTEATTATTKAPSSASGGTPAPVGSSAAPPVPTFPEQGQTYSNPITFRWEGKLGTGQSYQVLAWHRESGYSVQSPLLTTTEWTASLPGDKFGEWRWNVSVVQGGRPLATSTEGMFWFNPFPGGGGGGGGGPAPEPTDTPEPYPYPPPPWGG